mmetsp:Transcript_18987/g.28322  ORF Transcript_18987/g.28322 Transcript_18987/m.28322 type:complete len:121 (-) Transcript_18987:302-664(-)
MLKKGTRLLFTKKIISGKYYFPIDVKASKEFKTIVGKLLTSDPRHRLGCHGLYDLDVRREPWFEGIHFKHIREKKVKAPFVPTISDPFDDQNFENWRGIIPEETPSPPLSPEEQTLFDGF